MTKSNKLLHTGIFSALLFLFSLTSVFAETTTRAQSEPTTQSVSVQSSPQAEPFSADEMSTLQTQQEALATGTDLQQMQVGAGVDGTIVLSVIVAILIILVIAAIL